ncbi:MAG TPA: DUF2510 domain-containing protein [Acidimicrobiales bacterium]|nr:DUF2510 domain-containing protein [Acidimicrobiales bacterium]
MALVSLATSAAFLPLGGMAAPAAGAAGSPTTTGYPPIATVMIQNPLPNFTVGAPGPTNGPLTAAELGALSTNPQQAESQFNRLATQKGFGAYLRLWTDANGPGKGANDVVVTLYRIPNLQDAASFASGSQQPYQQPGAATAFSVPSIPGAHGYTVSITSPSQVTEQVVLFRTGPYVAIVQLASSVAATNPAPLNPSDAIAVSFQQYTGALHAVAIQTAGAPAGTPSTAKSGSALPAVLAIIAGVLVLGAVAWLAAGPPRERRRRRRAIGLGVPRVSHDANAALPIDVPSTDTRPVRLARGPVIRVVEVEPRSEPATGQPRAVPAARMNPAPARPEVTGVPAPEPALGPAPPFDPEPVLAPGPPSASVYSPAPFEPEPVLEPGPEPVYEAEGEEVEAGPAGLAGQRWADPEPVAGSFYPSMAEPDLEEMELAESALADLAALELAELAGPVPTAEEPSVVPTVEDPMPAYQATTSTPGDPNGSGSAAAPFGRIELPPEGTPAGWLRDPSGSGDVVRYWDGQAWTSHVATRAIRH